MEENEVPQSLIEIEACAREIHKDDTRWGGEPYITHPEWMANKFTGYYRKAVSWLHDTVEDHPDKIGFGYISKRWGPLIAKYVEILTHREGEEYHDYITRIGKSKCRVSIDVKMMDLRHNMIGLKQGSNRYNKYMLAYKRLEEFAKFAHIE